MTRRDRILELARLPVSRRRFERLEDKLYAERERSQTLQRACSRLGHDRDQAYRDAAKLITDLRIVKTHLDHMPGVDRVRLALEIPDAVIFDGFRRDGSFRAAVVHIVNEMFERNPAKRNGWL
jgi:hypothetical protein